MDVQAIRNAPPVEDLTTATPRRIDERNARLDTAVRAALAVIAAMLATAHRIAGDRYRYQGRRKVWGLDEVDAERIMRERIADGTVPLSDRASAPGALERLEQARRALSVLEAGQASLDAEFRRRGGWTRFFTVPGGHVHSGQRCVGGSIRPSTMLGWNPELSGKSEAEALAHFGAVGHVLCTHCFPNAPVIVPVGPARSCDGSRKPYREGTRKPSYPNGTAECTGCGTRRSLTPSGYIRAHKPPGS